MKSHSDLRPCRHDPLGQRLDRTCSCSTGSSALDQQQGGDHYRDMVIQPVVFIYENKIPFIEACAIKYVCRHRNKNGAEDIRKAIHFLNLLLELEYKNE